MSGHGHVDPSNRKAAILIAIFAACLALAETVFQLAIVLMSAMVVTSVVFLTWMSVGIFSLNSPHPRSSRTCRRRNP